MHLSGTLDSLCLVYIIIIYAGIPLCDPNPCLNGGVCTEVSDTDFQCNCAGTLHEGRICQLGLVEITGPSVVTVFQVFSITIRANPTEEISLVSVVPPVFLSNQVNPLVLSSEDTTRQVQFTPYVPGPYSLTFSFSEPSSYMNPNPFPVFVRNNGASNSPYYQLFSDDDTAVKRSCCQLKPSVIQCGSQPVELLSSCSWTGTRTSGIVFSSYNGLEIPISFSGLHITTTQPPTFTTFNTGSCAVSNSDCMFDGSFDRTEDSDNVCYEHKPQLGDLEAFLSQESLATTFLSRIRNLLPNWLELATVNEEAINNFIDFKFIVSVIASDKLSSEVGCESITSDKPGYFAVLHYDGPLLVTLEEAVNVVNAVTFNSPMLGSSYCITVNLCSGSNSPVYIGIPLSVQSSWRSIGFISEYINRGWDIQFLSAAIVKGMLDTPIENLYTFWNSIVSNYHPPLIQPDLLLQVESRGSFENSNVIVQVEFNGQLYHTFTTNNNEVNTI